MGKVMGVLVMEGMTVADQGDYQRLMNKLQDRFSNAKLIAGSTEEEIEAMKRRKRLNGRIYTVSILVNSVYVYSYSNTLFRNTSIEPLSSTR